MRIGIPRETRADETRVAATPDVARKYVEKGAAVVVESGAGRRATYDDAAYASAGVEVVPVEAAWSADVVLKVQPPTPEEKIGVPWPTRPLRARAGAVTCERCSSC